MCSEWPFKSRFIVKLTLNFRTLINRNLNNIVQFFYQNFNYNARGHRRTTCIRDTSKRKIINSLLLSELRGSRSKTTKRGKHLHRVSGALMVQVMQYFNLAHPGEIRERMVKHNTMGLIPEYYDFAYR